MAAPSDWIATTRQAIPQFWALVTKLKPTMHLAGITELDAGFLDAHQVAALLWDVDGTLMPHHHSGVAPEFQAVLKNLETRVPQAILSNCGEIRLAELGRIFPELPVFKAYRTPEGALVLRQLLRGEERWTSGRGAARERLAKAPARLTPVKKPSGELIDMVLDQLGDPPRDRVFMVGDQYFTDIAGANLAGIKSVKVPTYQPASFPLPVRTFQLLERLIYRIMR